MPEKRVISVRKVCVFKYARYERQKKLICYKIGQHGKLCPQSPEFRMALLRKHYAGIMHKEKSGASPEEPDPY
jgi:hypothetical protein